MKIFAKILALIAILTIYQAFAENEADQVFRDFQNAVSGNNQAIQSKRPQLPPSPSAIYSIFEEKEIIDEYKPIYQGNQGQGNQSNKANAPRMTQTANNNQANKEVANKPKMSSDGQGISFNDGKRELSFRDADLRQVLEIVSKMTGQNIFLDELVPARKINTFIQDISLEEALPYLLKTNGLEMKKVDDSSILVFPKNKERDYLDKAEYKTYFLSNVKVKEMVQVVKSLDREAWISINEELNAMVVKDSPGNLMLLDTIVADIDKLKPQVLLDMRLLETSAKRLKEMGISFEQPLSSLSFPNHPNEGEKVFRITSPNALIRALEEDDGSKILARPKLRLVDGKNAKIRIADRIPLKITTHTTDSSNTTFTDKIEWQDAGIKFEADLLGIHKDNVASVKIKIEVSSVIGTTTDGYPEIRTREAESTLRVVDGETIVVGGLLNTKNMVKKTRVPLLSRLPLLGSAFTHKKVEEVDSEIIIFLSPHFVYDGDGGENMVWAKAEY